jgi:hypothetical protein
VRYARRALSPQAQRSPRQLPSRRLSVSNRTYGRRRPNRKPTRLAARFSSSKLTAARARRKPRHGAAAVLHALASRPSSPENYTMADPALIASAVFSAGTAVGAWRSSFISRETVSLSSLAFIWPTVRVAYDQGQPVVWIRLHNDGPGSPRTSSRDV